MLFSQRLPFLRGGLGSRWTGSRGCSCSAGPIEGGPCRKRALREVEGSTHRSSKPPFLPGGAGLEGGGRVDKGNRPCRLKGRLTGCGSCYSYVVGLDIESIVERV